MPKPVTSFFSSSSSEFLSEMEPSMIQPRNFIGLEWMEGIYDEKSVEFFGSDTEKGVAFINLSLIMTILLDLSAQKSKLVHFRAFVHQWRSVLAPDIEEDSRFKSSMKDRTKASGLLLITNLETFVCKDYIHTCKEQNDRNCASCKYSTLSLCQLLVADSEKDLLKIPT